MEYHRKKSIRIRNIIRIVDNIGFLLSVLCNFYIIRFDSWFLFLLFFSLMYTFAHRVAKGTEVDKLEKNSVE